MRRAENDVLVNLIREHVHMRMTAQDRGDRFELFAGVDTARRVRRRAHDEQPRVLIDGALELLRRDAVLGLDTRLHRYRLGARKANHLGIAHPVRRRNQNFVARPAQNRDGHRYGLLRPVRADDIFDGVLEAVVLFKLVDDYLPKLRHTGVIGVVRLALVDGPAAGLRDYLRRAEVGLAGTQADDGAPGLL